MRTPNAATLSTTELFCKAAEKLSFTDAAKALGTTPSAISKALRRLEDRLGIALFLRTTRSIRLTEDGHVHESGKVRAFLDFVIEKPGDVEPVPARSAPKRRR